MTERDWASAGSIRTGDYRYRRWPGIDCPVTISGHTPLGDVRSNGVQKLEPVCGCLVALSIDRENRSKGCHHSRQELRRALSGLAICWSVNEKRNFVEIIILFKNKFTFTARIFAFNLSERPLEMIIIIIIIIEITILIQSNTIEVHSRNKLNVRNIR